jgi:hypothetical protein
MTFISWLTNLITSRAAAVKGIEGEGRAEEQRLCRESGFTPERLAAFKIQEGWLRKPTAAMSRRLGSSAPPFPLLPGDPFCG